MDALTAEMHAVLMHLGQNPGCISHRMEHYIEHIFHLLPADHETIALQYFGILGKTAVPLDRLAETNGYSLETIAMQIETDLRRLAVTPEWQMVRRLIQF